MTMTQSIKGLYTPQHVKSYHDKYKSSVKRKIHERSHDIDSSIMITKAQFNGN